MIMEDKLLIGNYRESDVVLGIYTKNKELVICSTRLGWVRFNKDLVQLYNYPDTPDICTNTLCYISINKVVNTFNKCVQGKMVVLNPKDFVKRLEML